MAFSSPLRLLGSESQEETKEGNICDLLLDSFIAADMVLGGDARQVGLLTLAADGSGGITCAFDLASSTLQTGSLLGWSGGLLDISVG